MARKPKKVPTILDMSEENRKMAARLVNLAAYKPKAGVHKNPKAYQRTPKHRNQREW